MSWKHISGWVQVTSPEFEGPVRPGWGAPEPPDPDYDRPAWGGRPDNDLPSGGGGHVWGALIRWLQRPSIDNDPSKPPGRPVLPPHPDNGLPPNGGRPPHPWRPGHWDPIDLGPGKPPAWGWILGPDNGLPVPPGIELPDNSLPGTPGARPDHGLPTPPGLHPGGGPITPPGGVTKPTPPGQGGAWVPTDPDFGKPVRPCPPVGGKPHPPIWAWIPDRPDAPTGGGGGTATVTLYPTSGTTPATGGSGSINVTITTPGQWEVSAASVPDWLTVTPMGPQVADVNVVYTSTKNATGMPRTATLKVNAATFTLSQSV